MRLMMKFIIIQWYVFPAFCILYICLPNWGIMAQFQQGQEIFLPINIQASIVACPDSYSVGSRGSSAVDKVAR